MTRDDAHKLTMELETKAEREGSYELSMSEAKVFVRMWLEDYRYFINNTEFNRQQFRQALTLFPL